ncbi:MAG: hypothetical protein FJ254_04440 [Phycisphaerae bacterium]|nr:hypothetical protein [Phycisphaerae bacterium]
MPTYEYACTACGHEFEEFQSIKADPIRTCPRCKKRKVERKIGLGGAVIFRGGGFYETDYRSADYEQAKKADAAPAAGSAVESTTGKGATTAKESGKESERESGRESGRESSAKDARDGAKAGDAPKSASTDATPSAQSGASDRTSGESSGSPDARDAAARSGESNRGKNHAREGRGIGNVLQLGRAKASGAKSLTTKSSATKAATTKSSPSSKPARTSTGKRKSSGR